MTGTREVVRGFSERKGDLLGLVGRPTAADGNDLTRSTLQRYARRCVYACKN